MFHYTVKAGLKLTSCLVQSATFICMSQTTDINSLENYISIPFVHYCFKNTIYLFFHSLIIYLYGAHACLNACVKVREQLPSHFSSFTMYPRDAAHIIRLGGKFQES